MEYILPLIVILFTGISIYTTYKFTERLITLQDNINILKNRLVDTTAYFYKQNQELKRTNKSLAEIISILDDDIDDIYDILEEDIEHTEEETKPKTKPKTKK